MSDLVALFEEVGARSVRSYIQSGNVAFDASPKSAASIAEAVRRGLLERFDLDAPIALRTSSEVRAALERNPFLQEGRDPKHLHLGFLVAVPDPDGVGALDPARSDVDAFRLVGRELYLHVPGGIARTRLTTAYFDRCLGTTVTVRNWRTVTRLAEL